MNKITTVAENFEILSAEVKPVFQQLRSLIQKAIPDGAESISYQIPIMKLEGKNVIYFAGWKSHVSLYPVPEGDADFQKVIAPYVAGKGTLKFMIDKSLPVDIIKKVILYSLEKATKRSKIN